jgi:hypothetical protein
MAKVTRHAEKRTRSHLGLPKRAAGKNAERALRDGIRHKDVNGSLRRFVDALYYTVYLAEDESVVAVGTASECARMMGRTTNTFYSTVHNTLSGSVNKYEFHREEISGAEYNELQAALFAQKLGEMSR